LELISRRKENAYSRPVLRDEIQKFIAIGNMHFDHGSALVVARKVQDVTSPPSAWRKDVDVRCAALEKKQKRPHQNRRLSSLLDRLLYEAENEANEQIKRNS
jgi:hypothetical protein